MEGRMESAGVLPAPSPWLKAMGGGMGKAQGEPSGYTGTPQVLLVPPALQGSVGIRCMRDAALRGGQGVPVPCWDLAQVTRAACGDLRARHPRVPWHRSLRSWGCRQSRPLSLSLLVPLHMSPP